MVLVARYGRVLHREFSVQSKMRAALMRNTTDRTGSRWQ